MLFTDPYPRVTVVPPRSQRRPNLFGRLLLVILVAAVAWHVIRLFYSLHRATERKSPAHVHANHLPARFVRSASRTR